MLPVYLSKKISKNTFCLLSFSWFHWKGTRIFLFFLWMKMKAKSKIFFLSITPEPLWLVTVTNTYLNNKHRQLNLCHSIVPRSIYKYLLFQYLSRAETKHTNKRKKNKEKKKLPEMISEKHFTQLLSGKTMLRHLIKLRTGKMLDETS